LVPIHKGGSKKEVSNYRTIMIASIFAKVLGGLLEARLSSWVEAHMKRAPSQAGFRPGFSTLDHILCLRVLQEQAKRLKLPLFCLFVDFSKAFDRVCRPKLWERLVSLGVPLDMRIAIAQLYQKVLIRFSSSSVEEVPSTLGVIQGCPLSPTLFGVFIDQLHDLLEEMGGAGSQLGTLAILLLIFADDVVLLAHTQSDLQQHLLALEKFCKQSGMQVNMKKTKCLMLGTKQELSLYFAGERVETVTSYKYLGVEFSQNMSWATCVKHRLAHGYKAFYNMVQKCKRASLSTWKLKKQLFNTLVRPVVLYGVQVWGPSTSQSSWSKVEAIQKLFLEMELGVKTQTPYTLLLAESGLLPLEVEALYLTLQYVMRVEALKDSRLPKQAFHSSRALGWYADVCRWAQAWDLSEHEWHTQPKTLWPLLHGKAIRKLWSDPSPRLQYFMRDVNPMVLYEEQEYLRAPISMRLRQVIARYRLSSHHLEVEEGRWKGVKRQDRVCTLCDSGSIENEYHVFIACRWYREIRVAHQILVFDLHDLFKLPPKQLGLYIMAIDRKRAESVIH
jgi:Reverse transcriptase (RNA-dependent DNA polymerase)